MTTIKGYLSWPEVPKANCMSSGILQRPDVSTLLFNQQSRSTDG